MPASTSPWSALRAELHGVERKDDFAVARSLAGVFHAISTGEPIDVVKRR